MTQRFVELRLVWLFGQLKLALASLASNLVVHLPLEFSQLNHTVFVVARMLLWINLSREDCRLVDRVLATLLPLLFPSSDASLFRVLAFEIVVCPLYTAFGSLLLLFKFLQHSLNPLMLIVGVPSLLCIVFPDLFVTLRDLSLSHFFLGLLHELLQHLLCILLSLLS